MNRIIGLLLTLAILLSHCKKEELQRVTKLSVDNLEAQSYSSIKVTAHIIDLSKTDKTEFGICYSETNPEPTINNRRLAFSEIKKLTPTTKIINGLDANTMYYMRVYLIEDGKPVYSEVKSLRTPQKPTITTLGANDINFSFATLNGTINANNNLVSVYFEYGTTIEYGHAVMSNPGTVSGYQQTMVSAQINNLSPSTIYHFRIKAATDTGTIYGNDHFFTTAESPLPIVTTGNIKNINTTYANCEGVISADGGTNIIARGVCWSTSPIPTTNNATTNDGIGLGTFTSTLFGLAANTTYYVRAYATNVSGTGYGNEIQFTTAKNANIAIEMVLVNGGTFIMGGGTGQTNLFANEQPTHQVTLTGFYMGKYEITQAQYTELMGVNPSYFSDHTNKPVEQVSWFDAISFCNKLSEHEGLSKCYTLNGSEVSFNSNAKGYRLPTEAEWEYAARGGTNYTDYYTYSGGNSVYEVGWVKENSYDLGYEHPDYGTHPVGSKKANKLGIYDLSGNVWEWCWDWFGSYTSGNETNPTGGPKIEHRVYRGGCWAYETTYARSSARGYGTPENGSYSLGFRVVRIP